MDKSFVDDLRRTIDDAATRMLAIDDDAATVRPAPHKWSRKEIVGHLIDSAVNNQARFVRGQLQEDLVFDGYEQDKWVRIQRYAERPWKELVEIWRGCNQQIAATMRAASPTELGRARTRHNLQQIAFVPPAADTVVTLEYLMHDYVRHLQHHLRQVLDV